MSEITTIPQSKNELTITDLNLNTVEELLTDGFTLTEIFTEQKVLPISLHKFYSYLRKPENKEIKARIEEARKIGVQNIVDKLLDIYQADINQDTLDPNLISWIREKTKFIQWIAGKTSNLYSDKKDLTLNKTTNQIIVSWLDSPELEQKYTQYEKTSEEKKEIIEG